MKKLDFKPTILGVAGSAASGKDSVAKYFARDYGFKRITLSDYLRAEARKRKLKCTRDNLRKLQKELRKKHGDNYLISRVIETIEKKDHIRMKNVIIVGLRTAIETKLALERLKIRLIFVDANSFIRYQRAKARQRTGFSKNYEQFLHEEAIENATFDFHKTAKMAEFKIDNSGTLKETQRQADEVAKKLKLKKIKKKSKK